MIRGFLSFLIVGHSALEIRRNDAVDITRER